MDYQTTLKQTSSRSTGKRPAKGDMCPPVASEVSVPPPNTKGLDIELLSETAGAYLRDLGNEMI